MWDTSIASLKTFKRGAETKRVHLKDQIRYRLKKLQENFCIYCDIFDSTTETHIEQLYSKEILSKIYF